jgi:hypothetical protein
MKKALPYAKELLISLINIQDVKAKETYPCNRPWRPIGL